MLFIAYYKYTYKTTTTFWGHTFSPVPIKCLIDLQFGPRGTYKRFFFCHPCFFHRLLETNVCSQWSLVRSSPKFDKKNKDFEVTLVLFPSHICRFVSLPLTC